MGYKRYKDGEQTRRIASHVSFLCLAPMSLPYASFFYVSLAYLAPLTLPWVSSLCLSSKRDRGRDEGARHLREVGERDKRERGETRERETGEGQGRERGRGRGRETRERDKKERQWERDSEESHQETPHPHFLAPPHTFNLSITVLPQIHLNVEALLAYLYMLVARQESAL